MGRIRKTLLYKDIFISSFFFFSIGVKGSRGLLTGESDKRRSVLGGLSTPIIASNVNKGLPL